MAELHVRNLPPELHRRLRERSVADGRSMSAEAIVLLRHALGPAGDRPTRHQASQRLREIQLRTPLPAHALPAEALVREDRDGTG